MRSARSSRPTWLACSGRWSWPEPRAIPFSLLHLATYSGMRRGEALALRWENVNLAGPSLRVMESAVKTRHGGTVVVPRRCMLQSAS